MQVALEQRGSERKEGRARESERADEGEREKRSGGKCAHARVVCMQGHVLSAACSVRGKKRGKEHLIHGILLQTYKCLCCCCGSFAFLATCGACSYEPVTRLLQHGTRLLQHGTRLLQHASYGCVARPCYAVLLVFSSASGFKLDNS